MRISAIILGLSACGPASRGNGGGGADGAIADGGPDATRGGAGGATSSTGGAVGAAGGTNGGLGGAGGSKPLPTITGFAVLNQLDRGGLIRCDGGGTCFKTNDVIYRMAPNGTRFDFVFPDPAATSAGVNLPAAGIAFDGAGNVYTATERDIVKIAPGAATATYLGIGGPSLLNPAIGPSLAVDASGDFYLGFSGSLGWLPAGTTDWLALDTAYSGTAYDTVISGGDIYFAGTDLALVLRAGASSLATVGDSPRRPNSLVIDSRGDLLGYFFQAGAIRAAVYRLAAGGTTWTATSTLNLSTGLGGQATNLVIDDHDNAYIVASDTTTPARSASLFQLPAGSLTWTKLFDIHGSQIDERCAPGGSLANDHIGHLILQCTTTLFRSQP